MAVKAKKISPYNKDELVEAFREYSKRFPREDLTEEEKIEFKRLRVSEKRPRNEKLVLGGPIKRRKR